MTSSVRCRTLIFSWFLRHSPRHVPQGNLVYSTTSMLSSSIIRYILPYRKHSAAVQSTRTSSKASTRRSERDNASKADRAGSSQHVGEHLYSSLCSLNERRNQNLPGVQKAYNHSQSSFSRCDARLCLFFNIYKIHCSFPSSFVCISCMHAASELFSWSTELLAFASRQVAPNIVDIFVRFIRMFLSSSM